MTLASVTVVNKFSNFVYQYQVFISYVLVAMLTLLKLYFSYCVIFCMVVSSVCTSAAISYFTDT